MGADASTPIWHRWKIIEVNYLNLGALSTRIKDAGIVIRHSRGYIISILQGLEMGWRGLAAGVSRRKSPKRIPKSSKRGSPKSSKSQNWFADHPSPILERPPPLFAIFGRASQIFEKMWVLAPLGLVTLVHGDESSNACSKHVFL